MLFSLIGVLVLIFALYVLVTAIIDLIIQIVTKIKKCMKKSESIHPSIDDDDEQTSNRRRKSSISWSETHDLSKTTELSPFSPKFNQSDAANDKLFNPTIDIQEVQEDL